MQAGTLWLEVTEAASPHGLFPLSGSSPDVGVVGYTLGGGLSWLARKHGLAANNVTAIELVTPDGELVRATADEHADLFWALRGGGGNFGVVTAMEFRLFPYGEVYAGMFLCRSSAHGEVLRAWRDWTRTAPEDVTTSIRLMHLPPLPELPPFLRGRSVAVIDGAFAGSAEDGAEAVAALRALEPELDTWAPVPAGRAQPHPHGPARSRCRTPSASRCSASSTTRRSTRSRPPIQPGAPRAVRRAAPPRWRARRACPRVPARSARLDGEYLLFAVGLVMAPEMAGPSRRRWHAFSGALSAYETGSALPQLRRGADRRRARSTPTTRTRASARSARPSTRTAVMVGEPPDPAERNGLTARRRTWQTATVARRRPSSRRRQDVGALARAARA